MTKKLNKEQQEVWDRLKHGILSSADWNTFIADELAEALAINFKETIDKEILTKIINEMETQNDNTPSEKHLAKSRHIDK